MNPIVLYVNPLWRRKGVHSPLMQPWWGNPYEKISLFSWEMFDAYSFNTAYYTLVDDITKADMVFVPYRHNWLLKFDRNLLEECIRTAEEKNLPILLDGLADIEYPVGGKNIFVLRCGGYRFKTEPNSIHIPLATDDLLERTRAGQLSIRKKKEGKPTIGFAAWTKMSLKQRLVTMIKELSISVRGVFDEKYRACRKGILWRREVIDIIRRSPLVALNLRERRSFSANPKTAEGDMRKLQEEMVNTILESDYALDVRGDGNNSARLHEILSLGRIPVIVDTERNFPFKDKVDYSSFSIIIDFRDVHRLPEIVAEFHKNVSPERYEEMQRNAREAYVKYFRIDAMIRFAIEELLRILK